MPIPWYTPSTAREAVDAIENCKNIISFLSDTISQESHTGEFKLSEDGVTGLFEIYSVIEGVLSDSANLLVREVNV